MQGFPSGCIVSKLFLRVLWSILAIVVCAWPTEVFLIVRYLASPEGFWQELFLAGLGMWVLGSAQLVFLVLAIFWLLLVWED